MKHQLTQSGKSFVVFLLTTLIYVSLLIVFVYDFFSNSFVSSFPTTYLMIITGFSSLLFIFLILVVIKPKKYEDIKPLTHRMSIFLTLVMVVSTSVAVIENINTKDFALTALILSIFIFFLNCIVYYAVLNDERKQGTFNKHFTPRELKKKKIRG